MIVRGKRLLDRPQQIRPGKRLLQLQAHTRCCCVVAATRRTGGRSQHDHRHVPHVRVFRAAGQFLVNGIAVAIGQHQIQQHQIGFAVAQQFQTFAAVAGCEKIIASPRHKRATQIMQGEIIVNQKDGSSGAVGFGCGNHRLR